MGLDISFARTEYEYGFRAGSYSGFGTFRDILAAEEDIILNDMWGFGGGTSWSEVDTSLEPLLNHSDCDGELYAYQAEQMLPRMKEIVSLWDNGHFTWDRNNPKDKLSDDNKKWYARSLHDWIKAFERIIQSEKDGIYEHIVFA